MSRSFRSRPRPDVIDISSVAELLGRGNQVGAVKRSPMAAEEVTQAPNLPEEPSGAGRSTDPECKEIGEPIPEACLTCPDDPTSSRLPSRETLPSKPCIPAPSGAVRVCCFTHPDAVRSSMDIEPEPKPAEPPAEPSAKRSAGPWLPPNYMELTALAHPVEG